MLEKNAFRILSKAVMFDLAHFDSSLARSYLNLAKDSFSSKLTGKPDLSSEAFFWEREFHKWFLHGRFIHGEKKLKNCKQSIMSSIIRLRDIYVEPLKLVDVGCGPTSQFYSEDLPSDLSVLTVDPLAKIYNRLHKQYKTGYAIPCVEGYGETLHCMFKFESFHLVYSQNSIDHSQNPKIFVKNLVYLVKKDGFLVLHGFMNEGSNAGWLGLHQWNIDVEGDGLVLSNRLGNINRESLTDELDLKVEFKLVKDGMYTFVFTKGKGKSSA
jgi:SAM-dependent methyltransferase